MMGISDPHFPWPRYIGLKYKKEIELADDLRLEQWTIAKGTKIVCFQSKDFGYVIVPPGSVPNGIKRIFKY